ncbi:uncharacterized protein NECHADRAFT_96270 [Fusarium vanettenii 77-13-4]|uniref:Chitin-binding type-4 domain-containing protein n=1 Tax=Fusarium vanettenii (strain ATCC MYA-4622 / CBS 123669 / FGSC 9596 / NRRL 45880 / 77-13-4) TaxID=660122 RepID=C7YUA6_FUSV7|nr:uncharacterized protein NECHADRAFT_96270 [Fusarium vanettenii 77-13-4]EEU44769.1 hypothetical protein NECHADRAFT_96270 [Fusarium vanettenii 77-13-4]
MFAKTFTLASLATFASAHMLMNNPVPFGKSTLNNAPLDASGSDFPCKMREGTYDLQGASNVYAQGSTQQLSFTGQAVHGGGSCQISITTDENPDKNSVWKVIKSIEGGCPAKGQEGNMGGDPNAEDPYKYSYTIPKELAAGKYTLAWTWFNKVGNREMYMNCAPLEVTGSGGSKDHLSSLPDMFVANIGNNCGTEPDKDVQFPSPGDDVDRFNGATEAWAKPTGSCPAGSGSGSGGSACHVSACHAPTTTATPATPSYGSGDGSESGNGSGSGDGTESGGDSGSGSPSGGFAAGTACTSEGEWNCIGGSSFQRCASGAWTATQQLSGGVSCTPGQAADIGLTAKRGLRAMRRVTRFRA